MRTFELLGGKVEVDAGKEAYHDLMAFADRICRELYSLAEADFKEKHMDCKAVADRMNEFKQSYIMRYSTKFSDFIRQRFSVTITSNEVASGADVLQGNIYTNEIIGFLDNWEKNVIGNDKEKFLKLFNIALHRYMWNAVDACVYSINIRNSYSSMDGNFRKIHVYNLKEGQGHHTDKLALEDAKTLYNKSQNRSLSLSERKSAFFQLINTYPYYIARVSNADYFKDIFRLLDRCEGQLVEAAEFFGNLTHNEVIDQINIALYNKYSDKSRENNGNGDISPYLDEWKAALESYGINESKLWEKKRKEAEEAAKNTLTSSAYSSVNLSKTPSSSDSNPVDDPNKPHTPAEKFGYGLGIVIGVLMILGFVGSCASCMCGGCVFLFTGCGGSKTYSNQPIIPGAGISEQDLHIMNKIRNMEADSDCYACIGCVSMSGSKGCCGNVDSRYLGCIDCMGITVGDDDTVADHFSTTKMCNNCYWVQYPMMTDDSEIMPSCGLVTDV